MLDNIHQYGSPQVVQSSPPVVVVELYDKDTIVSDIRLVCLCVCVFYCILVHTCKLLSHNGLAKCDSL